MKNSRIITLLITILMVLSLAGGCGLKGNEGSADAAISVTDMAGKEVHLADRATRIVALTASDCEILYAIGAGDTLVGRGQYCDYPAAVSKVPSVQSGYETNIEEIIALKPQVVIMAKMNQTLEQVTAMEKAGIKVIVSDAQDIEGVYTSIELLGTVTAKDAEATALVDSMKSAFSNIADKAKGDGTETVYFEVSALQWGLWTTGSGTFMNEIADLLGLKNAFADIEGWAEISEEQVIERNPDYIVTTTVYSGDGQTPTEEIAARKGWQNITAVKKHLIFNADPNEISRPGPRLADAAETLSDFVYSTK